MIEKLQKKLYDCEEVEALVLGGSRATGTNDDKSDYDFYVYLSKELDEKKRRGIIDEFVSYMEYSNSFWELEDDGILLNGIDIELIYRTVEGLEESMENLLVKGYVSNGYSTCFVDNLLHSKMIFDKLGRIKDMREKYSTLLTCDFYDKIIFKNFPILMDKMPSLFYQVEKAKKRNDILSINHRSSAYFEMYFDIVFALNRVTHPGEKRMLEIASALEITPIGMKDDIKEYFDSLFVDNMDSISVLRRLSENIYNLLLEKGYSLTLDSYRKKR